jgi:hypothetical protein
MSPRQHEENRRQGARYNQLCNTVMQLGKWGSEHGGGAAKVWVL